MAYLARSLTHAVGAEGWSRGVLEGEGVDLNLAPYRFGFQKEEHSAQFNRPIQRLYVEDDGGRLIGFYQVLWQRLTSKIITP